MFNLIYLNRRALFLIAISAIFITHSADDDGAFLQQIAAYHDPNDAQKTIRMRVRGNKDACLSLLKLSTNPIADLHCINARIAMQISKDYTKDFTIIQKEDLESYRFAAAHFYQRVFAYKEILPDFNDAEIEHRAKQVVEKAALKENIFAQLLNIYEEFSPTAQELDFRHACKLRALMKSNGTFPFPEVQYAYGVALMHSAGNLGHEGLKHRVDSGFVIPRYQEDEPNKQTLFMCMSEYQRYCGLDYMCCRWYLKHNVRLCWVYDSNPDILLARNKTALQQFLDAKKPKKDIPETIFALFERHDLCEIRRIIKQHHISISNRGGATVSVRRNQHVYEYITATDEGTTGYVPLLDKESPSTFAQLESFLKDALFCSRDGEAVEHMLNQAHYLT